MDPEYLDYQKKLLAQTGVVAEPAEPTEGMLLLSKIRCHYLDWGGSGKPVIFLHGGGLNAHSWDLMCLGLKSAFRCLAIDLRGHGDSEWSAGLDYRPSAFAGDVVEFISMMELDKPAVVGFSLGGNAALACAIDHHGAVDKLVVIEAALGVPGADGHARLRQFMTVDDELPSFDAFVAKAVGFRPSRDPDLLRFTLRWNTMQLPNGNWTWKYDRRHRRREDHWVALGAERRAYSDKLSQIRCPTLLIHGERSDVVSTSDFHRIQNAIGGPVTAVEIPNMRHSIFGDDPLVTIDLLRNFLAK